MDQFLQSLPKPVIAMAIIAIGFLVMILKDPPRTDCDSQIERFAEQEKDALYPRKSKAGVENPALLKTMFDNCQNDNSPGGCFEFFTRLKKVNLDLEQIPRHCADAAADDPVIKNWIFKSLKLIGQIAWGAHGPATPAQRNGWLDASDLALYCALKKNAVWMVGPEKYEEWRTGVLVGLPGAETVPSEQTFAKSVYSINCENFR